MKRPALALLVVAILVMGASASSLEPRIKALEAQVAALTLRVAALEAIVTPTPTPTPTTFTGLYGTAIGMDGLANTTLGGLNHPLKSTMRFRAEFSAALSGFRVYMLNQISGGGYGGGTGGLARFTLQTNNPATNLPSGIVLAERIVTPVNTGGVGFTFDPAPSLTAGTLYHLVCENVDPNPGVNYFALDYAYRERPQVPHQPKFADLDWAHAYIDAGAWVYRAGHTPILDLTYASGAHQGMGYMEIGYPGAGEVGEIAGSKKVRELFTVSGGTRTVSAIGIRVVRQAGSDPLTLTLLDGSGTIATATIPAASIAVGDASSYGIPGRWVEVPLAATLTNGATYRLQLSTAAGTTYWAFVIRKGVGYGYSPATYFGDGVAQKTADGSTWSSLGRVSNQNDLQFYFGAP